jgi:hypothetical protein
MVGYCVLYFVLYFSIDSFAKSAVAKDANSTWKNFTELKSTDKYLYISYLLSIINAIVLIYTCIVAAGRCEPPEEHRMNDVKFGNTYLRNTWCVENPNVE